MIPNQEMPAVNGISGNLFMTESGHPAVWLIYHKYELKSMLCE